MGSGECGVWECEVRGTECGSAGSGVGMGWRVGSSEWIIEGFDRYIFLKNALN